MPGTAYVRRDGRDVMVSLYFYSVRATRLVGQPRRSARNREILDHLYGRGADLDDVRTNLPRFIEYDMTHPRAGHGLTWGRHVEDWWGRPGVVHTTYEGLKDDTPAELHRVVCELTGESQDPLRAELAARRFDFEHTSGRAAGTEDRSGFQRKGQVGDWVNHFARDAGEVFDAHAGSALVEAGYATDRDWWRAL